jgi:hypothetical protein
MLDWLSWLNQCMSALVATWGVPEASHDNKKSCHQKRPLKHLCVPVVLLLDNMSGRGAILVRDAPTGSRPKGSCHLTKAAISSSAPDRPLALIIV